MRNFLYLFIVLYTAIGVISCEKGEKLTDYEELVILQFNGLPNGTTVFRNGAEVSASGSRSYKVPVGEATYGFEDQEGNVMMEQKMDVTGPLSITVFDSGNGLVLVTPIDDVEVTPDKLKLDIANLTGIAESDKINLAVYRLNLNFEAVTEPTIITEVSSGFKDEFVEVEFGDLSVVENGESGIIYILDDNMEPYRKNGLPIAFLFNLPFDNAGVIHKVYKIVLSEKDELGALEGPFGAYEEGFFVYQTSVPLSK